MLTKCQCKPGKNHHYSSGKKNALTTLQVFGIKAVCKSVIQREQESNCTSLIL